MHRHSHAHMKGILAAILKLRCLEFIYVDVYVKNDVMNFLIFINRYLGNCYVTTRLSPIAKVSLN